MDPVDDLTIIVVSFLRLDLNPGKVSALLDPASSTHKIRQSYLAQLMLGNLEADQRSFLQYDKVVARLWYTTKIGVRTLEPGTFVVHPDLLYDVVLATSDHTVTHSVVEDLMLTLVMTKHNRDEEDKQRQENAQKDDENEKLKKEEIEKIKKGLQSMREKARESRTAQAGGQVQDSGEANQS